MIVVLPNHEYHLYESGPVDWWAGWMSPAEVVELANRESRELVDVIVDNFAEGITGMIRWLGPLFRSVLGWEGDGDFRCAVLPAPEYCDTVLFYAVKQRNNGQCFFASPYPLPWLEVDDAYSRNAVVFSPAMVTA